MTIPASGRRRHEPLAEGRFDGMRAIIRAPDDAASQRVMDKLGMRYAGMAVWDGARVPVHELTRADWCAHATHPAYF